MTKGKQRSAFFNYWNISYNVNIMSNRRICKKSLSMQCKPICIKTQHHTYRGSAYRAATVHGSGEATMRNWYRTANARMAPRVWQMRRLLQPRDGVALHGSRSTPARSWSSQTSHLSDVSDEAVEVVAFPVSRRQRCQRCPICHRCYPVSAVAVRARCCGSWHAKNCIRLYSPCRCRTSPSIYPAVYFSGFLFYGGVMDKLGYKISGRHDWSWST